MPRVLLHLGLVNEASHRAERRRLAYETDLHCSGIVSVGLLNYRVQAVCSQVNSGAGDWKRQGALGSMAVYGLGDPGEEASQERSEEPDWSVPLREL